MNVHVEMTRTTTKQQKEDCRVKQGAINMTTMTNTETSRECRLRYE